ncbi:hypothetical protein [Dongia sp. agr-C8]
MTVRRIIGMVMLAAALMFGAAEFWLSVMNTYGAPDITMGSLWLLVSARSLNIVQSLITEHVWSPLWNLGISPLLVAPAWSFFGALGLLFFIFGRPKVVER